MLGTKIISAVPPNINTIYVHLFSLPVVKYLIQVTTIATAVITTSNNTIVLGKRFIENRRNTVLPFKFNSSFHIAIELIRRRGEDRKYR